MALFESRALAGAAAALPDPLAAHQARAALHRETTVARVRTNPYALSITIDEMLHHAKIVADEQHREAELFLSAAGSDCGIANVNIGTSGAEIGGG